MLFVGLAFGAGFLLATDFAAATTPIPPKRETPPQQVETQAPLLPENTRLLSVGLEAVDGKNFATSLKIRDQLTPGTVEHKALTWAIASESAPAVSASDLAEFISELDGWPMQTRMRTNYERAFLNDRPSAEAVIAEFEENKPVSNFAIVSLARAYLQTGQSEKAEDLIRAWWPGAKLSSKQQARYADKFKSLLEASDHKLRMDTLLYEGKTRLALRMSALAKAESLAKGRAAVVNKRSDAASSLGKVHESWTDDPGFQFSKILHARRKGQYETAATLLRTTPYDPEALVNPDKWWVERRIVSREMLERGKATQAYVLAAAHSATGHIAVADAEFHAGWFALRFLEKPKAAEEHFAAVKEITTTPISQSRALYWLGRSAEADDRPEDATRYFEQAAEYPGTFYGQLSHERLGRSELGLRKVSISHEDRKAFSSNMLARAITEFENIGDKKRAARLYRHLAKTLTDPAHLRLLALRLELQEKHNSVLMVGKSAFNRGIQIEKLAFPTGAIPKEMVQSTTDLAMMYAIARQESAFRTDAISPVGAMGLLQVMPRTARAMAKELELPYSKGALLRDPGLNAAIGAAYFHEQLEYWNGSYVLTLAAYNAGPGRVQSWLKRFGDPRGKSTDEIVDWIESIPFPETRNYVMRVMEGYQVYKTRLSQNPLQLVEDLAAGS